MKLIKVGKFYHYRFMVRGKLYRGSTELKNLKKASTAAEKIRTEIVMGNLGILERGPAPELSVFLKKSFLPYVENRHKEKPKTRDYYKYGAGQLADARIGGIRLDEITGKDVAGYIKERSNFSAAGINQGLRTLRRALRLAYEWRKIDRRPVINLAQGERQRERVLTADEERLYLGKCREPWRTMAIIIIELGLRPGEVFKLRTADISFDPPQLRISAGKSKAARRTLPMTDPVYEALQKWCADRSLEAWLFPSPRKPGKPYNQKRAFDWHHAALVESGVEKFEPYSLRHTALTRVADHCPNPFAVAAIAGHSSIVMTQKYVHPQRAEIERAFEEKSSLKFVRAAKRRQLKVVSGGRNGKA